MRITEAENNEEQAIPPINVIDWYVFLSNRCDDTLSLFTC